MGHLPYLLGFLALLVALLMFARSSWRKFVRHAVREGLEARAGVAILRERADAFDVRVGDTEGTLNLGNLFAMLSASGLSEVDQKAAIGEWLEGALSPPEGFDGPLDLAQVGDRIWPRLAGEELLARDASLLARPTGVSGLVVCYVLDGDKSVVYLNESQRQQLGLDLGALHAHAMGTLRARSVELATMCTQARSAWTVLKIQDTYDATRLLLVPEQLAAGESLMAAIPDRDTLVLCPGDTPAESLREVARTPDSPYLLIDRPLRVTRDGIALA